jgi:hypothetical protein
VNGENEAGEWKSLLSERTDAIDLCRVYRASDNLCAYPDREGVTPADLAATLFQQFGLAAAAAFPGLTGRTASLKAGRSAPYSRDHTRTAAVAWKR